MGSAIGFSTCIDYDTVRWTKYGEEVNRWPTTILPAKIGPALVVLWNKPQRRRRRDEPCSQQPLHLWQRPPGFHERRLLQQVCSGDPLLDRPLCPQVPWAAETTVMPSARAKLLRTSEHGPGAFHAPYAAWCVSRTLQFCCLSLPPATCSTRTAWP